MKFDDYLFHSDKSPKTVPAEREVQSGGPRTEATAATTVLDAMLALGSWKTTHEIAEAVNLSADDIRPVLEELLTAGTIERDGGTAIWIWQAVIEERLRYHGAIIAIDCETSEALPLFKTGDADTVKDTSDVYLPSEIELTPQQRADLTRAINRYEAGS
jgi:hypothetical protein